MPALASEDGRGDRPCRIHLRASPRTAALHTQCAQCSRNAEAARLHLVDREQLGDRGPRMSEQLYLCVHAAELPAQALVRLRPEIQSEPVAVLEGPAPLETVCALNRQARLKGVACGMTRLEAEA